MHKKYAVAFVAVSIVTAAAAYFVVNPRAGLYDNSDSDYFVGEVIYEVENPRIIETIMPDETYRASTAEQEPRDIHGILEDVSVIRGF